MRTLSAEVMQPLHAKQSFREIFAFSSFSFPPSFQDTSMSMILNYCIWYSDSLLYEVHSWFKYLRLKGKNKCESSPGWLGHNYHHPLSVFWPQICLVSSRLLLVWHIPNEKHRYEKNKKVNNRWTWYVVSVNMQKWDGRTVSKFTPQKSEWSESLDLITLN